MYLLANSRIVFLLGRGLLTFFKDEIGRGTFKANFRSLIKTQEIVEDMSWAELIEEKARKYGDRTFLIYEDKEFTFRQMDENANRVANFLLTLGAGKGKGVAIIMGNCPQYLDVYIGSQKIGMYSIPINTSLRGDSLLYILNHSDAEFVVIDEEFLDAYKKIADKIEKRKTVIVNRSAPAGASALPQGMLNLSDAYSQVYSTNRI